MTYRFLKRKRVHNFKGVIRGPTLFFYLYYKTPLFCYHDFLKKNSFSLSKKVFKSLCCKMCCCFKYCQAEGDSYSYCQDTVFEIRIGNSFCVRWKFGFPLSWVANTPWAHNEAIHTALGPAVRGSVLGVQVLCTVHQGTLSPCCWTDFWEASVVIATLLILLS